MVTIVLLGCMTGTVTRRKGFKMWKSCATSFMDGPFCRNSDRARGEYSKEAAALVPDDRVQRRDLISLSLFCFSFRCLYRWSDSWVGLT